MTLKTEMQSYALNHGWTIRWDHQFPNGEHLGLHHPNGARVSLTFSGPWPDPNRADKMDHCGYITGDPITGGFIAAETPQHALSLIRRQPANVEPSRLLIP